jgi:hypothetical protein
MAEKPLESNQAYVPGIWGVKLGSAGQWSIGSDAVNDALTHEFAIPAA